MWKIISILLCFIMVFSFCTSPVMAVDALNNDGNSVEVETGVDKTLLSCYKLLSRLKIISFDESLLSENKSVTIKEFAEMAMNALNIKGIAISGNTVSDDMSYYGFTPGADYLDAITYKEAARVVLKCIGYQASFLNIAEDDFSGWLSKANVLKAFAGVDAYSEDFVTYSDAANIWANALEIELVMLDTLSNKKTLYKVQKGKTLLSEYHNIRVIEGVVEANEYTSLYGESKLSENMIAIDGKTYKTSYSESKYYLGYNVMAYCTDSSTDENNLIFIRLIKDANNTLVLNAKDIDDYGSYKYSYYKNNKLKQIDIKNAAVIYNQRYLNINDKKYMIPKNGEIVFIDNDDDGKYEVVSISAFETNTIVKYISKTDMYVSDKYNENSGICLDESKYDSLEIVDKNANPVNIAQIKAGDVITSAKSVDGKIMTAIVGSTSVIGKLNSVETLDDGTVYGIGEDKYYVSEASKARIGAFATMGTTYRCLLDYLGNIVDMTVTGTDVYKYGYLKYIVFDENKLNLEILTEDGVLTLFKSDDKIRINDQSDIKDSEVLNLNWIDFKPQLIRYKLNSDGIITSLQLTEVTLNPTSAFYKMYTSSESEKLRWYSSQKCFSGKVAVSDKAIIFSIPSASQDADNDLLYTAEKNLKLLDNGFSSIIAYKSNKDNMVADVIVAVGSSVSAAEKGYGNIMSVSHITTALDENGDEAYKFSGVTKNGFESFVISKTNVEDNMTYSAGDIVRYTTYNSSNALDITKMFDYKETAGVSGMDDYLSITDPMEFPSSASFSEWNVSTIAYIIDRDGSYIKTNMNKKSSESYSSASDMYYYLNGIPLYLFDNSKEKEDKISQITDINIPVAQGSKNPYIYLFSVYGSMKFGVIYTD